MGKRIFLSVVILILLFSCQEKAEFKTESLFSDYEDEKGVFIVTLSPALVYFLLDKEKDAELIEAITSFEKVKTLLYRNFHDDNRSDDLYKDFNDFYIDNRFENIASVKKNNEQAKIYLYEINSDKKELVVLFTDNHSMVCIGCYGNIQPESLNVLMNPENIERLKQLKDGTI